MFYGIDARKNGVLDGFRAVRMCGYFHTGGVGDLNDGGDFFRCHFRCAGNAAKGKHSS